MLRRLIYFFRPVPFLCFDLSCFTIQYVSMLICFYSQSLKIRSAIEMSARTFMNLTQLSCASSCSRQFVTTSKTNRPAPNHLQTRFLTISEISAKFARSRLINPSVSRCFATSMTDLSLASPSQSSHSSPRASQTAPLLSKLRRRRKVEDLQVPSSRAVVGFAIKEEFNLTKLYEKIQVGWSMRRSSAFALMILLK